MKEAEKPLEEILFPQRAQILADRQKRILENLDAYREIAHRIRRRYEKDGTKGWTKGKTMRHIAEVPAEIMKDLRPDIRYDPKEFRRFLKTNLSEFLVVDPKSI